MATLTTWFLQKIHHLQVLAENFVPILKVIGLTATIGIGDSHNQDQATGYVLDMCAKIGLKSAPSQPSDVAAIMNCPEEGMLSSNLLLSLSRTIDELTSWCI